MPFSGWQPLAKSFGFIGAGERKPGLHRLPNFFLKILTISTTRMVHTVKEPIMCCAGGLGGESHHHSSLGFMSRRTLLECVTAPAASP